MKDVYTLSDLKNRERLDHGAKNPARLAVLGYPINHSASPAMHQEALDNQGLDMRYIKIEVKPNELDEVITRLAELDFIGCNITVPHKLDVMDSCDLLSNEAKELGAVNTIHFKEKIIGHNTDALGFQRAISEEFGKELSELKVMILGAGGGAGRALATHCASINCQKIFLVNRTPQKAKKLTENLTKYFTESRDKEKIIPLGDGDPLLEKYVREADIIVNATSLGLKQEDPSPLAADYIKAKHMVYDLIYNPPLTPLLKQANLLGAQTANGKSMLLHQGALSYQYWFLGSSPLESMRKGLENYLEV